MVGSDFVKAVTLANEWHVGQVRKGTQVPYISHLLAVAALVLEAYGDETMAIAALLHDALEDADVSIARIETEFGPEVARIVQECTDGTPGGERNPGNWRRRKEDYLEHLQSASREALIVSCADKLHNARSLLRDLTHEEDVWERFNQSDPAQQLWYYRALVAVFRARIQDPPWLPQELHRTVEGIGDLVARSRA